MISGLNIYLFNASKQNTTFRIGNLMKGEHILHEDYF